jgi:phage baseplate assembly protein W
MNIAYPFQFDSRGHTAAATDEDHIRQMIEELIFTSPGERVNRPDFGSGLMQMVFASNSPELAATIQFTLQAAIQHWLGDIVTVQDLEVESVHSTLIVDLKYVIRKTSQEQTATFSRPV